MNHTFHIANLITKSINQKLSEKEQQALDTWISSSKDNRKLYEVLTSDDQLTNHVDIYQKFDAKKVWSHLEEEMVPTRSFDLTSQWMKYAAGILLPLLIGASLYYYLQKSDPVTTIAQIDQTIVPGAQRATLKLADGGVVKLEGNESIKQTQQGTATVRNEDHVLSYSSNTSNEEIKSLVFNELTTPVGGRYEVQLSDGSQVILNAGSSLKYPVSFNDTTRTVYLTGEAYFDVTHNGSPFIIVSDDQNIRVLGTSFNVSAYGNEPTISTTLVEGSVQIETDQGIQLLQPGEQSILNKSDETLEVAAVNTDLYTSWIRGKFEFNNDNMEIVIKRLARWYDFEYVFENNEAVGYHFTGRIDNSQPISSILKILEATSDIQFELNDKTIIIK